LILIFININLLIKINTIKDFSIWGLGIGDWGLGIGEWGQNPKPQTPNPQPKTQ
jgi:hypothetical protein